MIEVHNIVKHDDGRCAAAVSWTPAALCEAASTGGRPMFVSMGQPGRVLGRVAVASLVAVSVAACGGAGAATGSAPVGTAPAVSNASRAGAGGGVLGGPVVAGDDLCKLLGPGDLAAAGVGGAGGPIENNQPPDAFFCVYRGDSSASGGVELDVFLSPTAADAHEVFPDLFGEYLAANVKPVSISGADEARMLLPTVEGSTDPALIGARKGRLTFGLGIGTAFKDADQTAEQLRKLAVLVLQRAGNLGS